MAMAMATGADPGLAQELELELGALEDTVQAQDPPQHLDPVDQVVLQTLVHRRTLYRQLQPPGTLAKMLKPRHTIWTTRILGLDESKALNNRKGATTLEVPPLLGLGHLHLWHQADLEQIQELLDNQCSFDHIIVKGREHPSLRMHLAQTAWAIHKRLETQRSITTSMQPLIQTLTRFQTRIRTPTRSRCTFRGCATPLWTNPTTVDNPEQTRTQMLRLCKVVIIGQ
mmetsp:Transcript_21939/g.38846  ORF Transcript_21939/g.38846 Transcript_21939/m.38846 type:complete len:227 (-) Transcript_21939:435-1115(-)